MPTGLSLETEMEVACLPIELFQADDWQYISNSLANSCEPTNNKPTNTVSDHDNSASTTALFNGLLILIWIELLHLWLVTLKPSTNYSTSFSTA